ncbi:hypothetical protein [Nocardia niwae]|uniref:hypothetical protein n=1 Tax=Nocardia niwae TaxID=626084 RepID=UPI0012F47C56|nr:hypothetical protein [Nocardia niwae]
MLHNKLALIASDRLQGPLADVAGELHRIYWHGVPDQQHAWEYLRAYWPPFRDAAREEIGTDY